MAAYDPATELRRLVGKLAFFLAGCYAILLFSGLTAVLRGSSIPLLSWATVLVPGAMFLPATYYAVKLHTTADPQRMKVLWPRCAIYSVIGLALLAGTAIALNAQNRA